MYGNIWKINKVVVRIENTIINVNQYIYSHKKEFNKEIGEKIKEIRINKNLGIDDIALRGLMSSSHLSQIESGINGITLNKFIILCNALESSPQEILEEFSLISTINEDIIYFNLQKNKNISQNIIEFMRNKK